MTQFGLGVDSCGCLRFCAASKFKYGTWRRTSAYLRSGCAVRAIGLDRNYCLLSFVTEGKESLSLLRSTCILFDICSGCHHGVCRTIVFLARAETFPFVERYDRRTAMGPVRYSNTCYGPIRSTCLHLSACYSTLNCTCCEMENTRRIFQRCTIQRCTARCGTVRGFFYNIHICIYNRIYICILQTDR